MKTKQQQIQERLESYRRNLGMAVNMNLEGATIFIESALEFLTKEKIMSRDNKDSLIKKLKSLENKKEFWRKETEIRAKLIENDFLIRVDKSKI